MGECERSRAHLDDPRSKNRAKRHVRLNSVALAALEVLRAPGDGFGRVVRTADGERLHGPRYWFEKALATAKIEGFHWHDLRHTFASRLTMAGVTIRAVQEAMGHKSIAMTVRYSHRSPAYKVTTCG